MDMKNRITLRQAARHLNVSHETVRRWVADEKSGLSYTRLGWRYFFDKSDLDKFVSRNTFNKSKGAA